MTQLTFPKFWKWHAVLLDTQYGSTTTKISECLGVNLRIVQRIRIEFDESNGDYKGTAARKLHSGGSHKKRTLEFF